MNKIIQPTPLLRVVFFLLADIAVIALTLYLSFLLRFDFAIPAKYLGQFIIVLPLFITVKIPVFAYFHMYQITWRFVGIRDMMNIIYAVLVSEAILLILIYVPIPSTIPIISEFNLAGFPRSMFIRDGVWSILFLAGLRLSKRILLEVILNKRILKKGARTIIVGAGRTAEMILRDIGKQDYSEFYPMAMLDDNPDTHGTYVHGVRVSGMLDDLARMIAAYKAEAVIVAIPNMNHRKLREVYGVAKDAGIKSIKIVPRMYDVQKPNINLKALEEISVEDLIGRPDVRIDYDDVDKFIRGRVVLVTGAGGSIGSELVTQVCAFTPSRLVLLDIDETEVYHIEKRLKREYPHCGISAEGSYIVPVVGDIMDQGLMQELFRKYRPEIVFHAAAYKHVPMMEHNAREAVRVNILGSYILAQAAVAFGVKRFIMISTDKAVEPTSVMGATKRVAEYVCKSFDGVGGAEFISVRFGNVLGSRGSVLPLFLEQLKQGGPLTITHKDMRRYFMTIHEAVLLVLQASVIGKGGEVLVLDMGDPVRIVNLAEELIRIHGLEPYKDIDIEFIGMRPGEKLFEEVLTAEEGTVASKHEKIFVARDSVVHTRAEIEQWLQSYKEVITVFVAGDPDPIRGLLRKHVRHYDV